MRGTNQEILVRQLNVGVRRIAMACNLLGKLLPLDRMENSGGAGFVDRLNDDGNVVGFHIGSTDVE